MAKTFLENQEAKRAEIKEIKTAVKAEIQAAQSKIADIEKKKTEAMKQHDRTLYVQLCGETDHLQEYINSNQAYMESLKSELPFEVVLKAWRERQQEFDETVKKLNVKLMKASSELIDIYRSIESAREMLNYDANAYKACIDRDTVPDEYAYSYFGLKAVYDVPRLKNLYNYLFAQDLITAEGQRK